MIGQRQLQDKTRIILFWGFGGSYTIYSTVYSLTLNPSTLTLPLPFQQTSRVLLCFFLLELVLRFIVWPSKCKFLLNFFNLIDTLSIVPLVAMMISDAISPGTMMDFGIIDVKLVLSVANVFRMLRILKIVNHNRWGRHSDNVVPWLLVLCEGNPMLSPSLHGCQCITHIKVTCLEYLLRMPQDVTYDLSTSV